MTVVCFAQHSPFGRPAHVQGVSLIARYDIHLIENVISLGSRFYGLTSIADDHPIRLRFPPNWIATETHVEASIQLLGHPIVKIRVPKQCQGCTREELSVVTEVSDRLVMQQRPHHVHRSILITLIPRFNILNGMPCKGRKPAGFALPMQKIFQNLDRDLPVSHILTLNQVIGKGTSMPASMRPWRSSSR